jgi:pimeloyl-ACP methyl ester carboxylesterase
VKQRIVFIPGILGSVLIDKTLAEHGQITNAVRVCEDHIRLAKVVVTVADLFLKWGIPAAGAFLDVKNLPDGPCESTNPAVIWGTLDMLHWPLAMAEWKSRLLEGDGDRQSGSTTVTTKYGNRGLFQIAIELARLYRIGLLPVYASRENVIVDPYLSFIQRLHQESKADVRIFPYDWRLSNIYNAERLAKFILNQWWKGQGVRDVTDDQRVVIIGHSMGGLLARYYIESNLRGRDYVKRLITVGTPHLGAPSTFTHLMGTTSATGISIPVLGEIPLVSFERDLVRQFCSILELMPVFDFVLRDGRREPVEQTHRRTLALEKHPKISLSALDILRRFRSGLVAGQNLDYFLGCHGITYDLIAGFGLNTIVGADLEERPNISIGGDGEVPETSASMKPFHKGAHNINVRSIDMRKLNGIAHNTLFNAGPVQEHCLEVLKMPASRIAAKDHLEATPDEELLEMAKAVVGKVMGERTYKSRIVRCIARIRLANSDIESVLRIQKGNGDSNDHFLAVRGLYGDGKLNYVPNRKNSEKWLYALIKGADVAHRTVSVGGVILFREMSCTPYVELVTWNQGMKLTEARGNNDTHAEVQFKKWFEAQAAISPAPTASGEEEGKLWLQRVEKIELRNYYVSPCSHCCDSLAKLHENTPKSVRKFISWDEPYVVEDDKYGYTTTRKAIKLLKGAEWEVKKGEAPAV